MRPNDPARTPCSQAARRNAIAKAIAKTASSRRIRRLATRGVNASRAAVARRWSASGQRARGPDFARAPESAAKPPPARAARRAPVSLHAGESARRSACPAARSAATRRRSKRRSRRAGSPRRRSTRRRRPRPAAPEACAEAEPRGGAADADSEVRGRRRSRKPRLVLRLDGGAQACRSCARVGGDLLLRRPDRAARPGAQRRLVAAHADREVGRARAPALLGAEEPLRDPVFERVEADHGEPSPRPQQLQRGGQRGLERAELVVHGDPQSLEDAPCRMAVTEARRSRNGGLDRLDELARALEGLLPPAPPARPRDLARVALLAVVAEDRGQVALAGLVDQILRRDLRVRIHTHVQGRIGRVGDPRSGLANWLPGAAKLKEPRLSATPFDAS